MLEQGRALLPLQSSSPLSLPPPAKQAYPHPPRRDHVRPRPRTQDTLEHSALLPRDQIQLQALQGFQRKEMAMPPESQRPEFCRVQTVQEVKAQAQITGLSKSSLPRGVSGRTPPCLFQLFSHHLLWCHIFCLTHIRTLVIGFRNPPQILSHVFCHIW